MGPERQGRSISPPLLAPSEFSRLSSRLLRGQEEFFKALLAAVPSRVDTLFPEREFERRFLVRLEDVAPTLGRATNVQQISQWYLPGELAQLSALMVFRAYNKLGEFNVHSIARARLRSFEDGAASCCLNIKGPKKLYGGRLDAAVELGPDGTDLLRPFATAGFSAKHRFHVYGEVGNGRKAEAHIDLIKATADGSAFSAPGVLVVGGKEIAFAIVEIEVSNDGDLKAVEAGQHNFGFLRRAVPLWQLPADQEDQFSSSRLSNPGRGFDKKVRRALSSLLDLN